MVGRGGCLDDEVAVRIHTWAVLRQLEGQAPWLCPSGQDTSSGALSSPLLLGKKVNGMYVAIDSRAREDHWPENSSSLWGVVTVRWRPGRLPLCLYCSGVFAIKMLRGTRITKNMFLKR